MGTFLAARLLTTAGIYSRDVANVIAAAATTPGDNGVKTTIITGLFGIIAALIAAAAMLVRRRGPDLSDLLEMHERLAVIEANQADMREDYHDIHATVKAILHRLEGHHE